MHLPATQVKIMQICHRIQAFFHRCHSYQTHVSVIVHELEPIYTRLASPVGQKVLLDSFDSSMFTECVSNNVFDTDFLDQVGDVKSGGRRVHRNILGLLETESLGSTNEDFFWSILSSLLVLQVNDWVERVVNLQKVLANRISQRIFTLNGFPMKTMLLR